MILSRRIYKKFTDLLSKFRCSVLCNQGNRHQNIGKRNPPATFSWHTDNILAKKEINYLLGRESKRRIMIACKWYCLTLYRWCIFSPRTTHCRLAHCKGRLHNCHTERCTNTCRRQNTSKGRVNHITKYWLQL